MTNPQDGWIEWTSEAKSEGQDLNRAICECVAKTQQEKERTP